MSIYHVTGAGGGVAADRTSFVGVKVPEEIRALQKPLTQTDKQTFRRILQSIVQHLEGKTVQYSNIGALTSEKHTEEDIAVLYSGLYKLLKLALRIPKTSLKQELFKQDLADLRIPDDLIDDLVSVLFGSRREAIDAAAQENCPKLPKLQSLNWRVDVAISTSVLNRVLEPSVMMEMALSDGKVKQFEVSISEFHKLRYSVAQVLKEMEELEKRNILKIQD